MLQYSRPWQVYGIGLMIMISMIWSLVFSSHGYFVYSNEYKQKEMIELDIARLLTEKEEIISDIIRLREDPKALEAVIHRELGYVYPDEYMLIMPEPKTKNRKEE